MEFWRIVASVWMRSYALVLILIITLIYVYGMIANGWMGHLKEGMSWIPMYMYASFWERAMNVCPFIGDIAKLKFGFECFGFKFGFMGGLSGLWWCFWECWVLFLPHHLSLKFLDWRWGRCHRMPRSSAQDVALV